MSNSLDLDRLEVIARAATPGPWVEDDGNVFDRATADAVGVYINQLMDGTHPDCATQGQPSRPDPFICTTEQRQPNFDNDAVFIATFNPELCLEMIKLLRGRGVW